MKKTNNSIRDNGVAAMGLVHLAAVMAAEPALEDGLLDETVGGEPKSFVQVVGVWRIEEEGTRRCWPLTAANGRRGRSARPASPTRREHSTASAMPNSSIASRRTRISHIAVAKDVRTSAMETSPYVLKASPAASTRAPASCSTSSRTAIT